MNDIHGTKLAGKQWNRILYKVVVEDTGNNVDVDDGHTDGHEDTSTWFDIVSRGAIGGSNVQL